MTLNIFAFGIAREIMGGAAIGISLPEGSTVEQLISVLKGQFPALSGLTSFAIAVNGKYANIDDHISPGDEVAIIPPVSGG
ncbi:molybdopterin converting factor subunit 1 [Nemorincola caseinilytica]|uniref:Molybdopterin synthase sulfur carrier subunit n=1 Tax=Nemorincola caseinilytica TaxID=2054315 RepID=A0ABP8N8J1_9BACT